MANLVKIKNVYLYTAITEDAAECYDAMKLLRDNNVQYTHLNWKDDVESAGLFAPISTWTFFDGEKNFNRTLTKLPIVHWEGIYDDDEKRIGLAEGLVELQNSQLLENLDKIVV